LELINGFESTLYMTVEQLKSHGQKFSQTYKKGFGVWKDEFDGMAKKTVIKLLLAKYAPLTVDVQKAIMADQSVINDVDTMDTTYIDNMNEPPTIDLEAAKKGVVND
jgi:recombination protein RecT